MTKKNCHLSSDAAFKRHTQAEKSKIKDVSFGRAGTGSLEEKQRSPTYCDVYFIPVTTKAREHMTLSP